MFNYCRQQLWGLCILVIGLVMLLGVPFCFAAQPFTDLPETAPAYPYAKYLSEQGILGGYADGSFAPERSITRAEMAALLTRAAGLPAIQTNTPTFKDVSPTHWAYGVIEAAAREDLLGGYPGGTFKPSAPVTRAETAALLLRLSKEPVAEVTLPEGIKDVSASSWSKGSIAAVLDAGIMHSASKESFAPNSPATRGQVARGIAVTLNLVPERAAVQLTAELAPLQGVVTIAEPGQRVRKVTGQANCGEGAIVAVGPSGKAELRFPDGSGLLLAANTEIKIRQAKGNSTILRNGSAGSVVDFLEIDVKQGQVFGVLASGYIFNDQGQGNIVQQNGQELPWWDKTLAKKTRVKVNIPRGVVNVQGTVWMVEIPGLASNPYLNLVESNLSALVIGAESSNANLFYDEADELFGGNTEGTSGQHTIAVLEGSVEVIAAGQSVVVGEGQSTSINTAGSSPAIPTAMHRDKLLAWLQAKEWVMQRAVDIQLNTPLVVPRFLSDDRFAWFNSLTFAGGQFVAVGNDGRIWTSRDGENWTARESGTPNNLHSITFGQGIFVTVGENGTILSSADGVNWTPQDSGTGEDLYLASFYLGRFVAVDGEGGALVSKDGSTWTSGEVSGIPTSDVISKILAALDKASKSADKPQPAKPKSGGGSGGSPPPSALTVQFNDAAYSVGEHDISKSILVTLNRVSESVVSVTYATYGDSALAGIDFTPANGILTFAAGETGQSFNVNVFDDDIKEGNKTVNLVLRDPTGGAALGSVSTAILTIIDNESPPTIQFDNPTYNVNEADGIAEVTVTLSHASENEVSVSYDTTDGTAAAGQDYTTTTGTLTFAAGETSKTIGVTIIDDNVEEDDETVNITLSNPTGEATLGSPATAVLTIVDDDEVVADPLVNWSIRNSTDNNNLSEVGFVNNRFMALKYQDIITSTTGVTWNDPNAVDLPPGAYLNGIVYNGSQYVIVGNSGSPAPYYATSADGVNWSNTSLWSVAGGVILSEACYADNIIVAVGSNGTIITNDGSGWVKQISGTDALLKDVIYVQELDTFIAVGGAYNAVILTSSDGITWSKLEIAGLSLNSVVYGQGKFVAFGDYQGNDVFITSGDGVAWSSPAAADAKTPSEIFSAVYAEGYFVGVGQGGIIITSPDGNTWTQRVSNAVWTLKDVAFGNGTFVAVGDNGTIVQSDPVSGVSNSTISPSSGVFDKNISEQADIAVSMTLNGNSLTAIKKGSNYLTVGTDYTVSGSTVTIKKEYLAQQETGELILTFVFSAGSEQVLTVTVEDTTPAGTGWEQLFGEVFSYGKDVKQTSDGGYVVVGQTAINNDDVILLKTKADGSQEWVKTMGLPLEMERGRAVIQVSDGYIIAGEAGPTGNLRACLIKTDAEGNMQWKQRYTDDSSTAQDVIQATDGNYVFVGHHYSGYSYGWDIYLVKTNQDGAIIWEKHLRTTGNSEAWERGFALQETADGGYIISGRTGNNVWGKDSIILIKTDSAGNEEWQNVFGNFNYSIGYGVQAINGGSGGYFIAGQTRDFGATSVDVVLIKTDNSGSQVWAKRYGTDSKDDHGTDVALTRDGGCVISGYTYSSGAYLIKTDSDGETQWSKTFGVSAKAESYAVEQTSDGGFVITGHTAVSPQIHLVKTDPNGNTI